jgi:hypothetical protein
MPAPHSIFVCSICEPSLEANVWRIRKASMPASETLMTSWRRMIVSADIKRSIFSSRGTSKGSLLHAD